MRLMTFKTRSGGGGARVGWTDGAQVYDLSHRWPSMRALLADGGGTGIVPDEGTALPLDAVHFLPPVPDTDRIFCIGLNYRHHIAETGRDAPERPSVFMRLAASQVGHGEAVVRPAASASFDYEGELAVVVGRGGRHIAAGDAMAHVAGYTCFAENSVRDWQRHSAQATPGKNFERSGAMGPWIATADEVGDPGALRLLTRLNGQVVQDDSVGTLVFGIPELIAYLSAFTTLLPGDVICTGTPSGVGSARTPKLWMKAGDVLEVEVPGVGTLRNPVVDEGADAQAERLAVPSRSVM